MEKKIAFNAGIMRSFPECRIDPAMSLLLLLKKLLTVVLLPPLMPLLLIAAGLLLLRSRRRLGAVLAWGGLLSALLLIVPLTVNLLTSPLEGIPVLQARDLSRAQAIVILGAGQRRHMPEYGGPAPNRLALERLRYGARLARSSGLPVLVTGGAVKGYVTEASLMAEVLKEDFGITPRWREERSLDTAGNARFTATLLKPQKIHRIVLVTHAAHMRRARTEFEKQGFEVFPAPTGFLSDTSEGNEFLDFLPGATAAYSGWYALHEWVGILAQKLRLAVDDPAT
ncbi:MAG: YdcF family protein [Rhodocyclaceae bacterium]|nr:YdcF family protein [Rhodocyclaceae bacterium]